MNIILLYEPYFDFGLEFDKVCTCSPNKVKPKIFKPRNAYLPTVLKFAVNVSDKSMLKLLGRFPVLPIIFTDESPEEVLDFIFNIQLFTYPSIDFTLPTMAIVF